MATVPIQKDVDETPFEKLFNRLINENINKREIETEIDRLIYELYGLTDEEIAIIEKANK